MKFITQITVFSIFILAAAVSITAQADGPSSTNYAIPWDTVDSGGGQAMSASYTLQDSIGQSTALGTSVSASYTLTGGFLSPPDFDTDGYRNFLDNCIFEQNADQRDTNADGFGNICDADLNNDGIVNAVDLGLLRSLFFSADPDADFNGDGVVNVLDLGIIRLRFFSPPGPSGIAN